MRPRLPGEPVTQRGLLPRLHVVTDDGVLAGPGFGRLAPIMLDAGGSDLALHVRGPRTTGARLHAHAAALVEPAEDSGALLLVNDRVDVALTTCAHGAHLGARSLPVGEARALLGRDRVVGLSVHSAPELTRAAADGANHAFVGTVFPTDSHPGRAGLGVAGLTDLLTDAGGAPTTGHLPVLAIGGMTPERVGEVAAAGAWGVAVLGGIWRAPDPVAALEDYLAALRSAYPVPAEGR